MRLLKGGNLFFLQKIKICLIVAHRDGERDLCVVGALFGKLRYRFIAVDYGLHENSNLNFYFWGRFFRLGDFIY